MKDQYIQLLTSDAAMQTLGNCWFNYLVWVFQTNEPKAWFYSRWFSDQHKKVVNNYEVFAHSFVETLDKDISEPDVKAAVSKLKCNKSAGNDSIVNEMIKAGAEVLSPTLCKLFNAIFNKGYHPPPPPSPNGEYVILCLYTNQMDSTIQVTTGITITRCLGKRFTSIVIKFNQTGFQKAYRTADYVFVFKNTDWKVQK